MDDVRRQVLPHPAAGGSSDCNSGSRVHVADLVFPDVMQKNAPGVHGERCLRRANTVALAKMAKQAKMRIIDTASEPTGSNGPIMEEMTAAAPSAKYVGRKGKVSAWDNAAFAKAIEATRPRRRPSTFEAGALVVAGQGAKQ